MASRTPFGNPDGSRSDIQDVVDGFVSFDALAFASGLGIRPDDLSVRVIVGAKGSGKTVYLRRLQASAAANASVYAGTVQQDLPVTSNIVKFCQCFKRMELTEKWMQLWYCAIVRSLVTHLLHAKQLSPHLSEPHREELLRYPDELVPKTRREVSVYSQVTEIIGRHHTARAFSRLFDDSAWAELASTIGEILPVMPPVYFFIDSVDEEYASAPMHWMQCQKGLFLRTMRFLRDPHFGGRLHVIACVRDHVLASVLRSEHQNRYRGEPHITVLGWSPAATEFFLRQKVARLPAELMMRPPEAGEEPTVERWLGVREVENRSRGVREPVAAYLLRHTRLLPRDVVTLGNALCERVALARERGEDEVPQAAIRECVRQVARTFGNEQLAICANHIASSGMPSDAALKGYDHVYTGDAEFAGGLAEQLADLIRLIGKDRFDETERRVAAEYGREVFGPESDALSVLWQNRLLGYEDRSADGRREVFFSELNADHFNLPAGKPEYLLHSCLIDAAGIAGRGAPVGGAGTSLGTGPDPEEGETTPIQIVWEPATGERDLPGRIGRYRILAKLGRGGMSRVWLAEDDRLGRRIALKMLADLHAGDAASVQRFQREARVLAGLDHEGIATIHSLDDDRGRLFFTMEYVEGGTLGEVLAGGPLAPARAFAILRQIGAALAYAHARGVVHRDLKPANVIVRPDGAVKVLDFGISKILAGAGAWADPSSQHPTGSGAFLGTPGYMSPEQTLFGEVDERSDVWAFGCCAFECLAGKRAFGGRDPAERIVATREREPGWEALPPLPEPFLAALRRSLVKDRADRLANVPEFLRTIPE